MKKYILRCVFPK